MMSVEADPQPTKLSVDPQTYIATRLGEVFTINVTVTDVHDLTGFNFTLSYNTTLLDVLDVVEGSFFQPAVWRLKVINETEGIIQVSVVFGFHGFGLHGSGTLVTINFNATYGSSASCSLDLYDTILIDVNENPITHQVEDGEYQFAILEFTVTTDKPIYSSSDNVTIHGNITLDSSTLQGLVALEVDDPRGNPMVVRTLQMGNATPQTGITVVEVIPSNSLGEPKGSFTKGFFAYFSVTLRNNSTEYKWVRVIINAYDGNMVPLPGVVGSRTLVSPGLHVNHTIAPVYIPTWAVIGNGSVYANAFTKWPRQSGVPYCPEKNAVFEITGSGQGAVGPPSPGNIQASYNITFQLANATTPGIYRVSAISSHLEQPLLNNAVFGVGTICVPDHYSTIQEAVDAAAPTNNSILVLPGTYDEHVIINKTVTLVAREPSKTIVDGTGAGTVITVTANNVEISRFTIQNGGSAFPDSGVILNNSSNCTISGNTLSNNHNGLYLTNSSQDNTISHNTITSNNGYGLNIYLSDNNDVRHNTLSNNNYGIYLNHSTYATLACNSLICNKYNFGILGDSLSDFTHDIDTSNIVEEKPLVYWLNKQNEVVPSNAGFVAIVSSANITVRSLNLTKNGQGVLFAFAANCLVERVEVANNEYGIYMDHSYNNIIRGSEVSNNTVGIHQNYCDNNIICHNNFINNTDQVDIYQSSDIWDDSVGRGNYWSDYEGVDLNSDGVGDTLLPHQDVDWYPLMSFWSPVHDVALTYVTFVLPCNESQLYPGWVIDVIATVQNEGDFTENITITAYYDGNPIETKVIHQLTPLDEIGVNFAWDTDGVAPGSYTISAEAGMLPGETDTTDNVYIDGNVTLLVPTAHDLNVTSVTPIIPNNYSHVYSGWVIDITVNIKNEGHFKETTSVTSFYDGNITDTEVVTLYPLSSVALNLTWNPDGVSPGNYTVSAEASVVFNETDTTNNVYVDGQLEVILWGDINEDGKVSLADVGKLDLIFSGFITDPWLVVLADINGDGKVSLADVGKLDLIFSGMV